MESEKPLSLTALIGSILTMSSLFIAYVLNKTVFRQSMQQLPSLIALAVLVLGIFLMLIEFRKT